MRVEENIREEEEIVGEYKYIKKYKNDIINVQHKYNNIDGTYVLLYSVKYYGSGRQKTITLYTIDDNEAISTINSQTYYMDNFYLDTIMIFTKEYTNGVLYSKYYNYPDSNISGIKYYKDNILSKEFITLKNSNITKVINYTDQGSITKFKLYMVEDVETPDNADEYGPLPDYDYYDFDTDTLYDEINA